MMVMVMMMLIMVMTMMIMMMMMMIMMMMIKRGPFIPSHLGTTFYDQAEIIFFQVEVKFYSKMHIKFVSLIFRIPNKSPKSE